MLLIVTLTYQSDTGDIESKATRQNPAPAYIFKFRKEKKRSKAKRRAALIYLARKEFQQISKRSIKKKKNVRKWSHVTKSLEGNVGKGLFKTSGGLSA